MLFIHDDTMAQRWLVELDSPSTTVGEAFHTFSQRLRTFVGLARRRSLGAGIDALRLGDVLASSGKLLVQLDPRCEALGRKLGAWPLVAMCG